MCALEATLNRCKKLLSVHLKWRFKKLREKDSQNDSNKLLEKCEVMLNIDRGSFLNLKCFNSELWVYDFMFIQKQQKEHRWRIAVFYELQGLGTPHVEERTEALKISGTGWKFIRIFNFIYRSKVMDAQGKMPILIESEQFVAVHCYECSENC